MKGSMLKVVHGTINSPKTFILIVYVVTLRAVTHKMRRQRLKSLRASYVLQYVCSKLNRASALFIHRDIQNMQDSYLNSIFAA